MAPGKRPSVFILDDDADLREVFAHVVESLLGRSCIAAKSYDEMLAKRDAVLDCQIAILDINLGSGRSGVDAYRWLRSEHFAGTVAFLTGHALDSPAIREAVESSEAKVYEKPLPIAELRRLIEAS